MFINEYRPGDAGKSYSVNGKRAGPDHILAPGDAIDVVDFRNYEFIVNGETVRIQSESNEILLVDLINHASIGQTDRRGRLFLDINGGRAKLTDAVKSGDRVNIAWKS
jgi:ribosomal 50S subunit-recycling heat shock protein